MGCPKGKIWELDDIPCHGKSIFMANKMEKYLKKESGKPSDVAQPCFSTEQVRESEDSRLVGFVAPPEHLPGGSLCTGLWEVPCLGPTHSVKTPTPVLRIYT